MIYYGKGKILAVKRPTQAGWVQRGANFYVRYVYTRQTV